MDDLEFRERREPSCSLTTGGSRSLTSNGGSITDTRARAVASWSCGRARDVIEIETMSEVVTHSGHALLHSSEVCIDVGLEALPIKLSTTSNEAHGIFDVNRGDIVRDTCEVDVLGRRNRLLLVVEEEERNGWWGDGEFTGTDHTGWVRLE